jgi:hypothetical protein
MEFKLNHSSLFVYLEEDYELVSDLEILDQ